MLNIRPDLMCWCLAVVLAGPLTAQEPLTRAERTDGLETSRYDDVAAFIRAVEPSPVLHTTSFGYSYRGRSLPLVVAGKDLADGSPGVVQASGRIRVLVMANIHAGEVEGKEAAQILLRNLARGEHGPWLDSLVILVAPLYNADGNEAVSVANRTRQNGPLGGVGERANAQGLDLNRDHMKLESPEARSLVALMNAYDPHLVVDLHTTNGTYHGYHLTYAPPLHPNTAPEIVELLRESWLPEVTGAMGERGWGTHYYGTAYTREGEHGWYTFDHRPRFNNNYVGLRNRLAILSEAYSYVAFPDRIRSTLAFVEEILDFAHAHAGAVQRAVADADAADVPGRTLTLRAGFRAGREVDILMGAVEERLSPYSGERYRARLDVAEPTTMREYGTFRATDTEVAPRAYYLPRDLTEVVDLLALHGVATTTLPGEQTLTVERFAVDSTRLAATSFQGHRERAVFGSWEPAEVTLPGGTVVVPMTQPLARLVFALLEPRSDDGVANWNVLDDILEAQPGAYPIVRQPARR